MSGGEEQVTRVGQAGDIGDAQGGQPPRRSAEATTGETLVVACPYCHSRDVELLALFGAQLLTDQYYCNACHTPFEHVRDG